MESISRRTFVSATAAAVAIGLTACSSASEASSGNSDAQTHGSEASIETAAASSGKHIIGVVVYNVADSEVIMFRQYLVDYVAKVCFEDVQLVYSNSVTSEEELLGFIDDVAAMGGEGVLSFINIDLAAEVKRCADHGMYHIVASGTVSEEDFAAVEDNEYFLGAIGPMIEMEYNAGSDMVRNYIANKAGDRYFLMSGGASAGNEMHYQRTLGMLDALETGYGVDLGNTKELAGSEEAMVIEKDSLSVTIAPGYVSRDTTRPAVIEAFGDGAYDVVLSTLPVAPIFDTLNKANLKIAQIDCYSQENQLLFASGKLSYLAGKYGSQVGPSFVAMYNAVTGHAADFRDAGKAFKVVQKFWSSSNKEDFDEKYEFASNITSPAFNYEDLYSICCERTPSVTLDDFKTLASATSFEDAKARRSEG